MSNGWDDQRIGDRMIRDIETKETYLQELRGRIRRKDTRAESCKVMLDRELARNSILEDVLGWKSTEEELRQRLEHLAANPPSTPPEVSDKTRWPEFIDQAIRGIRVDYLPKPEQP